MTHTHNGGNKSIILLFPVSCNRSARVARSIYATNNVATARANFGRVRKPAKMHTDTRPTFCCCMRKTVSLAVEQRTERPSELKRRVKLMERVLVERLDNSTTISKMIENLCSKLFFCKVGTIEYLLGFYSECVQTNT